MKPIFTFFFFMTLLFVNDLLGSPRSSSAPTAMVESVSDVTVSSSVSPSPAHDYATIKFQNPNQKEHQIEVFDLIGNKVKYQSKIYKNEAQIDVSNLDSGFYLYFILHNNKRVSSGRIVVR
ncbi:MAG: T9SS type A sorting domain-containing protein [Chitinophagales bacterium]